MLKIRLMGTTNDIKWFRKMMERDERIQIQSMSDILELKGTKKYRRLYAEIIKKH